MKVSLKFLPVAFLLFLIVSGLALMAVTSFFFYNLSLDRFLLEKEASLRLIANTIDSPYWVHQEATFFSGITRFFVREASKTPDTKFIRIVDGSSGKITVSSNLNEEGLAIRDLPLFSEETNIRNGMYQEKNIREISLLTSAGQQLWMGISTDEVASKILLISAVLGLAILAFFGLAGLLIFFIFNKLLLKPLFLLRDAFVRVGKEQYGVRLKDTLFQEMKEAFLTFNLMVEKIGKIREREHLIAKSKSQFIDIAAHQLRTPSSIFKWVFSALLGDEKGELNKEQKELIKRADDTNERFMRFVDDLLNVNRLEEGKLGYSFSYAKPELIIGQAVEEFRQAAKEKNIKYVYNPPKEPLGPMSLDVSLIRLAAVNLIENAIHYTPPGGEISISLIKKPSSIQFSVRDNGKGIPEREQQRVFEKFFRASNATTLYTEGVGLGLYLVKSIVKEHGGKVWFESQEGKGAIFFIELPY